AGSRAALLPHRKVRARGERIVVPLFRPSLRRTPRATGSGPPFFLLAGATYQGVATALERREFPPPGLLVSVGDHQLHIYCTGTGSPTVVLEAPAAGLSAAWG